MSMTSVSPKKLQIIVSVKVNPRATCSDWFSESITAGGLSDQGSSRHDSAQYSQSKDSNS